MRGTAYRALPEELPWTQRNATALDFGIRWIDINGNSNGAGFWPSPE
jgi:hypothetical protein